MRASGGTVRRTNCISPTPFRSDDFTSVLAAGEALYHRLGRPTIVKILSIGDDVDEMLADRGYTIDAPSQVLLAPDIASRSRSKAVAVETGAVPADWIEAWMAFGGSPPAGSFLSASLSAITLPAAYASYRQKGEIVALAYGIIHRGILGIDAVATRPDARGRGWRGRLCRASRIGRIRTRRRPPVCRSWPTTRPHMPSTVEQDLSAISTTTTIA